jgi:SAM-dependent methyltransferase
MSAQDTAVSPIRRQVLDLLHERGALLGRMAADEDIRSLFDLLTDDELLEVGRTSGNWTRGRRPTREAMIDALAVADELSVLFPDGDEPAEPNDEADTAPDQRVAKERAPAAGVIEKAADIAELERRLWAAADQLRANSNLMPSEYSGPVLGLLFLRYAEKRFAEAEGRIGLVGSLKPGGRREVTPQDYIREGIVYLPPEARFAQLSALPEGADLGRALNEAMRAIEEANPDLAGVLPRTYGGIEKRTLVELLRLLTPVEIEGDAFGRVYEYFMGNFAMQTVQKGGEFYTPASLVNLIVEIIEPFHGRILDPACGSGGMFVHSAEFVRNHQRNPEREISLFGIEKVRETIRLAKLNLSVHGLHGDIREANSYYEDPHEAVGPFDFVMANPPFNVDGVDKERIGEKNPRVPFGLPRPDNANYIARGLTEEEQRHIREGLTEEELALFDILSKPEPELTKAEKAQAKKVCKALLETLKVVNGPDEKTERALADLAEPRLRVVPLPRSGGASAARNAAVRTSTAPWIAFLDDDEWLPEKLSRQLEAAGGVRTAFPIVSCRVFVKAPIATDWWPRCEPDPGESISDYLFARRSLFSGEGFIHTSMMLTKRQLVERVPLDESLKNHEEWD